MPCLTLSLASAEGLDLSGPHRFLTFGGRTGLNLTSLDTRARLMTDLHRSTCGTLSLWFASLEPLGTMPDVASVRAKDPNALSYPLVSDALPTRDVENGYFGLWWNAGWYPKLMAKLCHGRLFPPMDFVMLPWVYADAMPLQPRIWYHVVFTWDRAAKQLRLYVNGMLAGHNDIIAHFDEPRAALNLGNPAFVLSDLTLTDEIWSQGRASDEFAKQGVNPPPEVSAQIRDCFLPRARPAFELKRGPEWQEAMARSFLEKGDLSGWRRQGPQYQELPHCGITAEGLLVQTPDELAVDTRTYLWSPQTFEGDLWVEYEFRPESPRGLALLVACASGPQREDFVVDHGLAKGGGMGTIIADRVRNYHWEYFRRVEAMRADVETQFLCKNPWQRSLAFSVHPRLREQEWHRLRFVKVGPRLHGSLDGATVFDVTDDAWSGTGPWYDFGRLALRQMYHTTIRYRNFSVHTRPTS